MKYPLLSINSLINIDFEKKIVRKCHILSRSVVIISREYKLLQNPPEPPLKNAPGDSCVLSEDGRNFSCCQEKNTVNLQNLQKLPVI